jgi:hypothetical protein
MPIVTDDLWNSQNVTVKVTYNTANPDNITKAVCANNNSFPIILRLNWTSHLDTPTDIVVDANSSVTKNPTAAEQADLNSFSIII